MRLRPHGMYSSRPFCWASVGNSLFKMVMAFCSGWSLSKNCSERVVGVSLAAHRAAGMIHASHTKKIARRALGLRMKSVNWNLKKAVIRSGTRVSVSPPPEAIRYARAVGFSSAGYGEHDSPGHGQQQFFDFSKRLW